MPPGPPESIRLLAAGHTSLLVEVRLSIYSYLEITTVTFVATDPEGSSSEHTSREQGIQPGGLATGELRELDPNTTYSIHAYATNSIGNGENSENFKFSTSKTLQCCMIKI